MLTKSFGAAWLDFTAATFLLNSADGARVAEAEAQAAMAADEYESMVLTKASALRSPALQNVSWCTAELISEDSQGRIRATWQAAIRRLDEPLVVLV